MTNALPDAWYRSCWYMYGADVRAVGGLGIYGQALYIHPASVTVFAMHSSYPRPLNIESETMQRMAFDAIAHEFA